MADDFNIPPVTQQPIIDAEAKPESTRKETGNQKKETMTDDFYIPPVTQPVPVVLTPKQRRIQFWYRVFIVIVITLTITSTKNFDIMSEEFIDKIIPVGIFLLGLDYGIHKKYF